MSITTTGDRLEVTPEPSVDLREPVADGTHAPRAGIGAAPTEVTASARPTFTITDAANACSVSRKTITRKLPELAGHGAAKDDDGVWRIPVEALLAVGLHPGRSLSPVAAPTSRPVAPAPGATLRLDQDTVTIPRDRWDDVRIRLARAEAEAAERGLALADARLALRALTAGPLAESRSPQPVALADVPVPSGGTDLAAAASSAGAGAAATQGPGSVEAIPVSASAGLAAPGPSPSTAPLPAGSTTVDAGVVVPAEVGDLVPADIVAARNHAARTGGYVPAGTPPVKKRRWWHSR